MYIFKYSNKQKFPVIPIPLYFSNFPKLLADAHVFFCVTVKSWNEEPESPDSPYSKLSRKKKS